MADMDQILEVRPLKFPYHEYEANNLQPCATTPAGQIYPIHLLACGHLVSIDNLGGHPDNRCGLNCLHVDTWMREQNAILLKDNSKSHTDLLTKQSLASNRLIIPKATKFHAQYDIYCEICHGIPASSYFVGNRETLPKRAIALTRFVIEYYTGYSQQQIIDRLCLPFHNSNGLGYDWKLTHTLVCGHEVWAQPARPCASNCSDGPECKGRIFPGNTKQADVIFCHECTYRAELVYERYAKAQNSVALSARKQPLNDLLIPRAEWDNPQLLDTPSTSFAHEASFGIEGHPPSAAVDDLPVDITPDGHDLHPRWDTRYGV